MIRIQWMFYKWKPVRFVSLMSKRIVLPGCQGVSLHAVSKFFFKELINSKINDRAASATFNFLMALPPTFLFLFSLVPYLPLKNVEKTILSTIKFVTPNNAIYQTVSKVIVDFMHTERKDLLSFGILLTLYYSSNGILGLMSSFDKSLSIYKERGFFARRWTAMKLTVIIILTTILCLTILIIQSQVLNGLIIKIFHTLFIVKMLSFLVLVALVFIAISLIYTRGPSLTHEFKFVSAGSVFATILIIIATYTFFFLVNNFINYNKVYGSIGTLIAFMVWLWLCTLIILIGYELNVSILMGKISQEKNVVAE